MKCSKGMTQRIFFLLLFLVTGSAAAISVRPVNLIEMVLSSDRVFLGKVVGIAEIYDSRLSTNVTVYTFSVLEGIRGPKTGDTVQVRQIGSHSSHSRKYSPVPGLPVYRKGQEVLLFLHGDSRFRLTSPVGLSQGVFRAVDMPDGRKGYINGTGNRDLDMASRPAYKSIPPVSAESGSGSFSGPGPITIEMVKSFVEDIGEKGTGLK
ncbi:MAG: hypothetical protein ABIJ42_04070 [Acidobacteriota bacterium]